MGSVKDVESLFKITPIILYGESGNGKTTYALNYKESHPDTIILDGDSIRRFISGDLGYTDKDRYENNRRVAQICAMLYHQGHRVLVSTVRGDLCSEILKNQYNIESVLKYINYKEGLC